MKALFSPEEVRMLRGWAPSGGMTHIESEKRRQAQLALRAKLDGLLSPEDDMPLDADPD